ncbi:amidohydrolase family protein [Pseudomonadales bacterium]|nr:amidohydrolase family protein [Pseudomonadales bacterium]
MGYQNQAWLDQWREPVIDPDQLICDPHHHLWDHVTHRYLLDEFKQDLDSGHRVVSTVFVECASMYNVDAAVALAPVGETEFVNGVAAMSASGAYGTGRIAAGIVGFADLMLGREVAAVLDAHRVASSRFRGIRHTTGWHESQSIRNSHSNPVAGQMGDSTFREGFAELAPRGLSFDAWFYHPQLKELIDLADAFPNTQIILDHFGGPLGVGPYEGKAAAVFEVWRKDMMILAKRPNVAVKLGGLVMPINGFGLHKRRKPPTSDELKALTGDYYRCAIEEFGPERCMFESNFPVDRQSCSYLVLWNTFKKLVKDASPDEKASLFHDTATRIYRL